MLERYSQEPVSRGLGFRVMCKSSSSNCNSNQTSNIKRNSSRNGKSNCNSNRKRILVIIRVVLVRTRLEV